MKPTQSNHCIQHPLGTVAGCSPTHRSLTPIPHGLCFPPPTHPPPPPPPPQTEAAIQTAREVYRAVAQRGSLVYFLVDSLSALDRLYHYSMANFVRIMAKGEPGVYLAARLAGRRSMPSPDLPPSRALAQPSPLLGWQQSRSAHLCVMPPPISSHPASPLRPRPTSAGMDQAPGGRDESAVPEDRRLGQEVEVPERVRLLIDSISQQLVSYVAQVRREGRRWGMPSAPEGAGKRTGA